MGMDVWCGGVKVREPNSSSGPGSGLEATAPMGNQEFPAKREKKLFKGGQSGLSCSLHPWGSSEWFHGIKNPCFPKISPPGPAQAEQWLFPAPKSQSRRSHLSPRNHPRASTPQVFTFSLPPFSLPPQPLWKNSHNPSLDSAASWGSGRGAGRVLQHQGTDW